MVIRTESSTSLHHSSNSVFQQQHENASNTSTSTNNNGSSSSGSINTLRYGDIISLAIYFNPTTTSNQQSNNNNTNNNSNNSMMDLMNVMGNLTPTPSTPPSASTPLSSQSSSTAVGAVGATANTAEQIVGFLSIKGLPGHSRCGLSVDESILKQFDHSLFMVCQGDTYTARKKFNKFQNLIHNNQSNNNQSNNFNQNQQNMNASSHSLIVQQQSNSFKQQQSTVSATVNVVVNVEQQFYSQQQHAQLNDLKERMQREDQENQTERERSLGKSVLYGQRIQLYHLRSGQYLSVLRSNADMEKASLKLSQSTGDRMCHFQFQPHFKFRTEGEPIRLTDKVIIMNEKTKHSIHISHYRYMRPLIARDSDRFEVNASSHPADNVWIVRLFRSYLPMDHLFLKGGDTVRIVHRDLLGALYHPTSNGSSSTGVSGVSGGGVSDGDSSCCCSLNLNGQYSSSSLSTLFQIEGLDSSRGGIMYYGLTPCRLKHVATGQYITCQQVATTSDTGTTTISSGSINNSPTAPLTPPTTTTRSLSTSGGATESHHLTINTSSSSGNSNSNSSSVGGGGGWRQLRRRVKQTKLKLLLTDQSPSRDDSTIFYLYSSETTNSGSSGSSGGSSSDQHANHQPILSQSLLRIKHAQSNTWLRANDTNTTTNNTKISNNNTINTINNGNLMELWFDLIQREKDVFSMELISQTHQINLIKEIDPILNNFVSLTHTYQRSDMDILLNALKLIIYLCTDSIEEDPLKREGSPHTIIQNHFNEMNIIDSIFKIINLLDLNNQNINLNTTNTNTNTNNGSSGSGSEMGLVNNGVVVVVVNNSSNSNSSSSSSSIYSSRFNNSIIQMCYRAIKQLSKQNITNCTHVLDKYFTTMQDHLSRGDHDHSTNSSSVGANSSSSGGSSGSGNQEVSNALVEIIHNNMEVLEQIPSEKIQHFFQLISLTSSKFKKDKSTTQQHQHHHHKKPLFISFLSNLCRCGERPVTKNQKHLVHLLSEIDCRVVFHLPEFDDRDSKIYVYYNNNSNNSNSTDSDDDQNNNNTGNNTIELKEKENSSNDRILLSDLSAFNNQMYRILIEGLHLLSSLCVGRHLSGISYVSELLPLDLVMGVVENESYGIELRSAMCEILEYCYLDNTSTGEWPAINLSRPLDKLSKNGNTNLGSSNNINSNNKKGQLLEFIDYRNRFESLRRFLIQFFQSPKNYQLLDLERSPLILNLVKISYKCLVYRIFNPYGNDTDSSLQLRAKLEPIGGGNFNHHHTGGGGGNFNQAAANGNNNSNNNSNGGVMDVMDQSTTLDNATNNYKLVVEGQDEYLYSMKEMEEFFSALLRTLDVSEQLFGSTSGGVGGIGVGGIQEKSGTMFLNTEQNSNTLKIKKKILDIFLYAMDLRIDYRISLIITAYNSRNKIAITDSQLNDFIRKTIEQPVNFFQFDNSNYNSESIYRNFAFPILVLTKYQNREIPETALKLLQRSFNQSKELLDHLKKVSILISQKSRKAYHLIYTLFNRIQTLLSTSTFTGGMSGGMGGTVGGSGGDLQQFSDTCYQLIKLMKEIKGTKSAFRNLGGHELILKCLSTNYPHSVRNQLRLCCIELLTEFCRSDRTNQLELFREFRFLLELMSPTNNSNSNNSTSTSNTSTSNNSSTTATGTNSSTTTGAVSASTVSNSNSTNKQSGNSVGASNGSSVEVLLDSAVAELLTEIVRENDQILLSMIDPLLIKLYLEKVLLVGAKSYHLNFLRILTCDSLGHSIPTNQNEIINNLKEDYRSMIVLYNEEDSMRERERMIKSSDHLIIGSDLNYHINLLYLLRDCTRDKVGLAEGSVQAILPFSEILSHLTDCYLIPPVRDPMMKLLTELYFITEKESTQDLSDTKIWQLFRKVNKEIATWLQNDGCMRYPREFEEAYYSKYPSSSSSLNSTNSTNNSSSSNTALGSSTIESSSFKRSYYNNTTSSSSSDNNSGGNTVSGSNSGSNSGSGVGQDQVVVVEEILVNDLYIFKILLPFIESFFEMIFNKDVRKMLLQKDNREEIKSIIYDLLNNITQMYLHCASHREDIKRCHMSIQKIMITSEIDLDGKFKQLTKLTLSKSSNTMMIKQESNKEMKLKFVVKNIEEDFLVKYKLFLDDLERRGFFREDLTLQQHNLKNQQKIIPAISGSGNTSIEKLPKFAHLLLESNIDEYLPRLVTVLKNMIESGVSRDMNETFLNSISVIGSTIKQYNAKQDYTFSTRHAIPELVLFLICSNSNEFCKHGLELGILTLENGNLENQQYYNRLLVGNNRRAGGGNSNSNVSSSASSSGGNYENFFLAIKSKIKQSILEEKEMRKRFSTTSVGTGVGGGTSGGGNSLSTELTSYAWEVLRFLQLLCEGHNLENQQMLQNQSSFTTTTNSTSSNHHHHPTGSGSAGSAGRGGGGANSVSIDLVSECIEYVIHLFKYLNSSNIDKIIQAFNSLNEFVQGPCEQSIRTLSHSSGLFTVFNDIIENDILMDKNLQTEPTGASFAMHQSRSTYLLKHQSLLHQSNQQAQQQDLNNQQSYHSTMVLTTKKEMKLLKTAIITLTSMLEGSGNKTAKRMERKYLNIEALIERMEQFALLCMPPTFIQSLMIKKNQHKHQQHPNSTRAAAGAGAGGGLSGNYSREFKKHASVLADQLRIGRQTTDQMLQSKLMRDYEQLAPEKRLSKYSNDFHQFYMEMKERLIEECEEIGTSIYILLKYLNIKELFPSCAGNSSSTPTTTTKSSTKSNNNGTTTIADVEDEESVKRIIVLQYYQSLTGSIEIIRDGSIEIVHFKKPHMCHNLLEQTKDEFVQHCNRETAQTKVADLYEWTYTIFYTEMLHLEQYYTKKKNSNNGNGNGNSNSNWLGSFFSDWESKMWKFLESYWQYLKNLSFFFSLCINIIVLISFHKKYDVFAGQVPIPGQDYGTNGLTIASSDNSAGSTMVLTQGFKWWGVGVLVVVLGLVQLLTTLLLIGIYLRFFLLLNVKKKFQLRKGENWDQAKKQPEFNKKLLMNILSDKYLWWLILFLGISLIGLFVTPLVYCLQLFEVVTLSHVLQDIVFSIFENRKKFFLFSVLTIFSLTAYAFTVFAWKWEQWIIGSTNACSNTILCFATTINYSVRAEAFLENIMDPQPNDVFRFFMDITFYFIVVVILLDVLFGLILDSFSERREARNKLEKEKKDVCFICHNEKSRFDIHANEGISFVSHIMGEHNMWNYVHFLIYLSQKPRDEYTGTEQYVEMNAAKLSFFPTLRSRTLEVVESGGLLENQPDNHHGSHHHDDDDSDSDGGGDSDDEYGGSRRELMNSSSHSQSYHHLKSSNQHGKMNDDFESMINNKDSLLLYI